MNQSSDFTVEVSGRAVPVTGLNASGIRVPYRDDLLGYSGPVRFSLSREGRTWIGELQVRAEREADEVKLVLSGPEEERRRLVSVLNWYAGRASSFVGQFTDLPRVDRALKGARWRQLAGLVGLGLLSLGLIVTISEILTQRGMSATSRVAYIEMPGAELGSNTAGQVVYVKQGGLIEKGEFFAALRTSQDYSKFLEADTGGDVSAQAVFANDYVRKGTPVLRLSDGKAVPHVAAFVRLSDAVAALNAAEARVEFTKSGTSFSVPVEGRNYVNSIRVMTDDDGKPLAEIRLRLPEGVDVPMDEPVVVKFGRPVRGLALLPRQWLSTLTSLVY